MATTPKRDLAVLARRAVVEVAAVLAAIAAARLAVAAWRFSQAVRRPEDAPPSDPALADRVRTALGPLERQLDVPHVHVMAERGVVVLHGDVSSAGAEAAIVSAARAVPGVEDVTSKLHVGLLPGDARPSEAMHEHSAARRRLLHAAIGAGAGEVTGERAVAAVLCALATEVGPATTARLRSHVSPDVAELLVPQRDGLVPSDADDVGTFYERIAGHSAMPPAHVPWVANAVLASLRSMVDADVDAVADALPPHLAHLWRDVAIATSGS